MRTLKTITAISLLALSSAAAQSGARPPFTLSPTTRVRVFVDTNPRSSKRVNPRATFGTVISMDGDSLLVSAGATREPYSIRLSDLAGLDTAAGRRRRTGRGLAIGLGVGVVAGAVIGAVTYGPCSSGQLLFCSSNRGEAALIASLGGGVWGTVLGGVVGFVMTTDRWAPVEIPARPRSMDVWATPTRNGFTFAAALTF